MTHASRRPRLSRRTCLIIAAVLVVGTEVSLETWWLPTRWSSYDATALGQVAVSDDGTTISLTVDWRCEQRPSLEARESTDRVTVVLHRREFKGPTDKCPEDSAGTALISTHLSTPLASRPLIDAVTGQPLPHG